MSMYDATTSASSGTSRAHTNVNTRPGISALAASSMMRRRNSPTTRPNGGEPKGKKSSIAKELLATLDGAWFHLGVDQFHHIRARRDWTDETFLPVFQRTVLGFHRAVAGMASAGNDVVVDHVLGERWRLADCLTIFD